MAQPPQSSTPSAAPAWPVVAPVVATELARLAAWPEARATLALPAMAGRPWLVAVSGGLDSTLLLLWLWGTYPDDRHRMRVGHVNHQLRGAASDGDAAAVGALAEALGLPCQIATVAPPPRPHEEALRQARYTALEAMAGTAGEAAIVLAHQRDDVAETLLFRLARGLPVASWPGLRAARPVRGLWRVRPLLSVSRAELRQLAGRLDLRWREDASNATAAYARNRLRQSVLPALSAALERDAVAGLARSAEAAREVAELFDHLVRTHWPAAARRTGDFGPLVGQPLAVWRAALAAWLAEQQPAAVQLPVSQADAVLRALRDGQPGAWTLPGGHLLRLRTGRRLQLQARTIAPSSLAELTSHGALPLPGVAAGPWGHVAAELLPVTPALLGRLPAANPRAEALLAWGPSLSAPDGGIAPSLVVRLRHPGDRLQPLGWRAPARLSGLLEGRGWSAAERARLPVVCMPDGTPLWCPGLAPPETHRVVPTSPQVLRLTYSPPASP